MLVASALFVLFATALSRCDAASASPINLSLSYAPAVAPLASAPSTLLSGSPIIDARLASNETGGWLLNATSWSAQSAFLGYRVPPGARTLFPSVDVVTTVRLLGGWAPTPDLKDPAWSDVVFRAPNGTFVMRWDVLFDRLDRIVDSGAVTPLIVLDNVPWALSAPNAGAQTAKYGNNMPPANFSEYADFVATLSAGIGARYGIHTVSAWTWRVGTEPNTIPNHWNASADAWVQMYVAAASGLLRSLPDARVGPGNFCALSESCGRLPIVPQIIEGLIAANARVDFLATSCYGSFSDVDGIAAYDPAKAAAATLALSALRTRAPSLARVPLFVMEHGTLGNEVGVRSQEPGAFGGAWFAAVAAVHGALGVSVLYDWALLDWGLTSVPSDAASPAQIDALLYDAPFVLRAWARTVEADTATCAAALVGVAGTFTACAPNMTLADGSCLAPRDSDAVAAAQILGMGVVAGATAAGDSRPPLDAGRLGPAPEGTLALLVSFFSAARNKTDIVNASLSFSVPAAWAGRTPRALAAVFDTRSSVFDAILAEAVSNGTATAPPLQVTDVTAMLTPDGLKNVRANSQKWLRLQQSTFVPVRAETRNITLECNSETCTISAPCSTPTALALWISPDFGDNTSVAAIAPERLTAAKPNASTPPNISEAVMNATTTLLRWYNWTTGYIGDASVYWPFWHTGNSIESLAISLRLTGDKRLLPVIENTFRLVRTDYHTPYAGNDDIQWHAHAWLRAWETTGNTTYLNEAQRIYSDAMLFSPAWAVWNATCSGCNWAENARYVNTITNALFLSGTARLALALPNATAAGASYATWAERAWAWSQRAGLRNSAGLYLDGVADSDCTTPVGEIWTYNMGAWLEGMAALSVIKNEPTFSLVAASIFDAATAGLSTGGIMFERSCDAKDGWCSAPDGRMFKGVFARGALLASRAWAGAGAASNSAAAARARAWALTNAASLLSRGSLMTQTDLFLSQLWQGPYRADNTPWVEQSAGLDLLLFALASQ